MSGGCEALTLYDNSQEALSSWGQQLSELGTGYETGNSPQGWLQSGQTAISKHLDAVCEREEIEPEALDQPTRERLQRAERARTELDLPTHCPHPTTSADRCLFHLPEDHDTDVTAEEIKEAFLRHIAGDGDPYGSDAKQFVGARLPELDLEYVRIDSADNHPIDLRFAEIGDLRLDDGVFQQELRLDHAKITGECSCYSTDFQKRVSFESAVFDTDIVDFEKTKFDGVAGFTEVDFRADAVSFEKCRFNDVAGFKHTEFVAEEVTFEKAYFNMESCFDETTMVIDTSRKVEHVNFEKATFTDDFSFKGVSIRRADPTAVGRGVKVSFRNACSTGNEVIINGTFGTFEQVSRLQPVQPIADNGGEINEVTLKGADFSDGTVEMTSAKIAGDVIMEDLDLTNTNVECNEMDLYQSLDMTNVSFSGGEVLFNNTTVHDRAIFTNVAFTGNERVSFTDVQVNDDFEFDNSKLVADKCGFEQMTVLEEASFDDVDIRSGKVSFDGATFGQLSMHNLLADCESFSMESMTVNGPAVFDRSEFRVEEGHFTNATFNEAVNFVKATLGGEITFNYAGFFGDTIDFSSVDAAEADLQFVGTRTTSGGDDPEEGAQVQFRDAVVMNGVFRQPLETKTVYDFEHALVGDIDLEFDPEEDDTESLFEYFRFRQTEFDGFDFSDGAYRANLKKNGWKLHTVIDGDSRDVRGRIRRLGRTISEYASLVRSGSNPRDDPDDLEATYRKAKIGADRAGDSEASSKFFQKELAYRRRSHGNYVWARTGRVEGPDPTIPERIGRGWLWLTNTVLWLISGYGERPKRVVISSLVTIGLFAIMYELTWFLLGLNPPDTVRGAGASLILSAEMFTAIILGGGEVANTIVRIISYIEGFIGSLFIALFVLTITRAVRR